MNVAIIAVDRLREPYLREGCSLYVRRLSPYMTVTSIEVKKGEADDARVVEGKRLLAQLRDGDVVWALDRDGRALASDTLAVKIAGVERSGAHRLALLIGGAGGLDDAVLRRADFRWSLSPLTFLHEMARLIVLEQLYRAMKIGRREPYHR